MENANIRRDFFTVVQRDDESVSDFLLAKIAVVSGLHLDLPDEDLTASIFRLLRNNIKACMGFSMPKCLKELIQLSLTIEQCLRRGECAVITPSAPSTRMLEKQPEEREKRYRRRCRKYEDF